MVVARLWKAKMADLSEKIGAEDFDRSIGNYKVVTDSFLHVWHNTYN